MGPWFSFYFFAHIWTMLSVKMLILTNLVSSLQPLCSDQESLALLNFKHSFHIDCAFSSPLFARPKVKSWTFSDKKNCCSWDGVECNKKTGQVIGLHLSSSCLHGSFPTNSSIFHLSHLTYLYLDDNNFNFSQIPSQFGLLSKLKFLKLSNSAFSGQIPLDISKLSRLEFLHISNGEVPTYTTPTLRLYDPTIDKLVQNLTSLQTLSLNTVDMSSTFPTTLLNLTSLKVLSLQFCNLYGEVPHNLFQNLHRQVLVLDGNINLVGSLPEFQPHSPLVVISLSYTSLSGELPTSIGKLNHLEYLGLESCRFSGLLPSSLSLLSKLTWLMLNGNNFQGGIPFSLMNLTNLEVLALSNLNLKPGNLFSYMPKLHKLSKLGLTGMELDSEKLSLLANFTKLESLQLKDTNLKGPFPKWLANLTQLSSLQLNDNELTGPIPQWISQLKSLRLLELGGTNLFVKFETFFNFKNLRSLDLSGTSVTLPSISQANSSLMQLEFLALSRCNLMEFPEFLQLQNNLNVLYLEENNITGRIPEWFVAITKDKLLYIDLSNNILTGFEKQRVVLPWNSLEYIDISSNKFHGQLPIPRNSMKDYSASSNLFSGVIPKHFCDATSLNSLDLSRNMLSGQIPHCVAYQLGDSLQMLDVRSNNLSGTIPTAFTRSCKVKMINLSNNKLGGHLPKSLVNCSMLEEIDIGGNQVNDTFPSWLGSLPKLEVLVLNHNNFHGVIRDPEFDTDFSLMRIIDLSHNHHCGELPYFYLRNWHEMKVSQENKSDTSNIRINTFLAMADGVLEVNLKSLEYSITITNKGNQRVYTKVLKVFRVMDFSSNNFIGIIPEIIGTLQGLQALNLSNNNLYGRIPPSLANISDLESLDLSQNMLSGEIPLALTQLTSLEVFNVSYNQLGGRIPNGNQFNTFDNSSFQGNVRLCGIPLSNECRSPDTPQPSTHAVTQDEGHEDSEFIDWIIKSFGFLSGCIVGYVIGKLFITDKYHNWFMETFRKHRPNRRVQRSKRHRT